MAKILIVEDDDFFREAICDVVKKKFSVLSAPNGKVAKEILMLQDVDLVISDIQMPNLTGLELLEWSKANKPIPFIIMTGFSTILETKSAFDLGAKGFIAKPFKNTELLTTIDEVLGLDQKNLPVEETKNEYCKVSIEEFVTRPQIDFDVYVKLSDSKIIKIAHKGHEIPKDKVLHYKQLGVKFLYIKKEDFKSLVEFNLQVARVLNDKTGVSDEKKSNFLRFTGEVILEKAFIDGVDSTCFNEAKSFFEISLKAMSSSEEHFSLLNLLNNHSDHLYAHSLGVALYSVMVAQQMGLESNSVMARLSMAGLFHDIGKKEIDRAILERPRHLLSAEEVRLIESHVTRGHDILTAVKNVPSEVIQIVYEHHEDMVGTGFPMQKGKNDQHPLSRIIQTVNKFIELTIETPLQKPMPGKKAIAHMRSLYDNRLDPRVMTALDAIFK